MAKKYYYRIIKAGEGTSSGFVLLTKKEAEIVDYALNDNNWVRATYESWSGNAKIDLDNPISEDEFNFSE